jgi:hypothetical protein
VRFEGCYRVPHKIAAEAVGVAYFAHDEASEGHGLGKKENAVDYQRRILQWFAHYLKGEPAASWITDGQSWLERKKRLDANK